MHNKAMDEFERMQYEGIPLDALTYVCILKAWGTIMMMIVDVMIYACQFPSRMKCMVSAMLWQK